MEKNSILARGAPSMGYETYFYQFDDLPEQPTYHQITRRIHSPSVRAAVFKQFADRYPTNILYRLGYVEHLEKEGLYDTDECKHCLREIDAGMALEDQKNAHQKLEKLRTKISRLHALFKRESHDNIKTNPNPDYHAFKAGRYDVVEKELRSAQDTITPRGILGGDDEKRMWQLHQLHIRGLFLQDKPARAIEEMDDYQARRLAVKLTPIPDFDVQEQILGYLAQQSLEQARQRLQFWLDNSRMPIISDPIKEHPAFAPLIQ